MHALKLGLFGAAAMWLAAFAGVFLPEAVRTAMLHAGWLVIGVLVGCALAAGARGEYRRPFLLLASGTVFVSAGVLVWMWYDVAGDGLPHASLADAFFAASLPLFAFGLLTWPRERRLERGEHVDGLLFSGAVGVISAAFVIGPRLDSGIGTPGEWLLLAYPIGHVAIFAAATFVFATQGFRDHGRMLVVAASLAVYGIADTAFALAGADYGVGRSLIDLGWTLGLLGIGAAALLPCGWGAGLRVPRRAAPIAVLAVLAAAVGVQVANEVAEGSKQDLITEALTGGLLLVLGIRHVHLAAVRLGESGRLAALTRRHEHESALLAATLDASRTGFAIDQGDGTHEYHNSAWQRLVGSDVAVPPGGGIVSTPAGRTLAFSSAKLSGDAHVVWVDDVTAHERERATRDRFLAEVVRAQDLEARRIAELLHDDAVQRLTALGMRLELAAMRSGEPALRELAAEAGAVTSSIRRLLVDLHPVILESQGVAAAVDGAAESLRATGLEVDVTPLELRLVPEHEHLAYRLVQEALANVVAHAEAKRVAVSFTVNGTSFHCRVEDDGLGIEGSVVEDAVANGSMGLHLVRERIDLAGGSFEIGAREGGGTSFSFALPLRKRDAEAAA